MFERNSTGFPASPLDDKRVSSSPAWGSHCSNGLLLFYSVPQWKNAGIGFRMPRFAGCYRKRSRPNSQQPRPFEPIFRRLLRFWNASACCSLWPMPNSESRLQFYNSPLPEIFVGMWFSWNTSAHLSPKRRPYTLCSGATPWVPGEGCVKRCIAASRMQYQKPGGGHI